MKIIILIYFLFLIQLYPTDAQRNILKDPKHQYELGKRFYSDIYVLPCDAADSAKIIIVYRASYLSLTFIKNNSTGQENYLAVPNFEVEFKDSDGIIRKRIFREDSVFVNTFDETVSQNEYVYGYLSILLKTGNYTVSAFLRSANSQLLRSKVFTPVEIKNFKIEKIISVPIISTVFEPDNNLIVKPYIAELGIPFSSEGASILIPVSYDSGFEKFSYNIKYTKPREKYFDWGDDYNFSGSVVPIKNASINVNFKTSKDNPIIELVPFTISDSSLRQGLLNIVLTSDKLVPGNYEFTITRENSKDTIEKIINVIWEDMPISLSDPDYAVEAMYYILKDDQFENMKDGKPQEVSKNILDFWKEKDPTPKTAFNEAMAEYFKRVDYAMQNFKLKNSKDGVKSDQGKIYILHGKPTKTDKTLGEKQNTELWKYDKLKKEFVFKTDISGNYILVQVNDIK